jgi:hypothetical protein
MAKKWLRNRHVALVGGEEGADREAIDSNIEHDT